MAGDSRRDLIYRMRVEADQAKAEWAKAGGATRMLRHELRQLEQQQRAVDDTMTALGQGMVVAGAAIGVGLGFAAKAAIQWESAWTGVAKVVDGTPEEMAALEEELRGLATTLPQTHAEIAGVAAAAGQLGIARKDIGEFTQTMVAMGVSTNLASEEAATALARMMNIMSTAPEDVDRLGSSIVGLGNSSATTEAEIVEMALRIAGAGRTVGLSEADVLGFAAALSSVGVEAEAGGSAISRAFVTIDEAVRGGGDALDAFARVAGVTADEFATSFRDDPAAAVEAFIAGLGRMNASGQDVFATLQSVGLSEIVVRDALLRLASAGDLTAESIRNGNAAWDENSALMEEAARRYGTTEAQIQIARNQLVDLGITLGEQLIPTINMFLDTASGLLEWFNSMPESVQGLVVFLGTAATAVGLLGGAALVAAPKVAALSASLGDMGKNRASKALSGVANVLSGPWAAAIGVGIMMVGTLIAKHAQHVERVNELTDTLDDQTGAITTNTRVWALNELEKSGAAEVAQRLGINMETLVDAALGEEEALARVNEILGEHNSELNEAVNNAQGYGNAASQSGKDVEVIEDALGGLNGELTEAEERWLREQEAMEGSTAATAAATTETQIYAEALGVSTDAADEATAANQEFDSALRALRDTMFGSKDAQAALTLEIQRATEAFDENGSSVDLNTESGALNHQAIMGLIAANHELISAEAESGATAEELAATTDDLRSDFVNLMRQAGISEEAIEEYADAFDNIPASKTTTLIQRLETVGQWNVPSSGILPQYADGGLIGFPAGGMIRGPGTGTSDSILIAASNGEFMVNAEATGRHRALLEAINSGKTIGTAMRHSPAALGMSTAGPQGGSVRVSFDFSNISDSMARAIRDTVKVEGDGNVQAAFGSR